MDAITILFTSCGRRVELIKAFRRAAARLEIQLCILAAELEPGLSAAAQFADKSFVLPRCDDPAYANAVEQICKSNNVHLWVPLLDPELLCAAENRDAFAEFGTTVLISAPAALAITRDKEATAIFLRSKGFEAPRALDIDQALEGKYGFPLFIKPKDGSSSIGCRKVEDVKQLELWWSRTRNPALFEFADGDEFTVDVYAGLDGNVRCAVPRQRLAVRAGEVSKGLTVENEAVISAAKAIVETLEGRRGVITLQCKVGADNVPRFFEINARFGGGAPLSIEAGADFPRWLLEELSGQTPEIKGLGFTPGLLMLRYDAAVFLSK